LSNRDAASRPAGSWPVLVAFTVVFVLGFWLLRAQSSVLMAERQQEPVRAMALRIGVEPASALALRAASPDVDLVAFEPALVRFAELSAQWCEELAAIAIAGDEATARAWAQEDGGPKAAFARRRGEPAALPGVAFAQRKQLFAMRPSGASR
jgi:hypothetical protein